MSRQTRVIPRPSSRRGAPGQAIPGASIDLRDPSSRTRASRDRVHSQQTSNEPGRSGFRSAFHALGVLAALAGAVGFGVLGATGRADSLLGAIVVPVLFVIAVLAINKWIRPVIGADIASVFIAGFGIRLVAAVPRFLGGADAPIYQREGVRIAAELKALNFGVDTGRSIPGTGTIRYLSGVVNVVTASNYITTFLLFASVAFIGQCFLLFALRRSLNTRQFRFLTVLTMLSPTLAFWPSSIGKESITLLGIGLASYGAMLLYGRRWTGVPPVLLGAFAIGMVRPHVALITLVAILVGLLARRAQTRGRMLTHLAVLLIVIVGSMIMAGASADLFGLESFDGVSDVNAALDFAQARTSQDSAQFVAARVSRPLDYPWAFVTVLFRPFPWEANSVAATISGVESVVLAGLLLAAVPGLISSAGQFLQRGQLLFSVAFTAVFVFLFSAIGNFGILSRQRAQVAPFVLVFVAIGLAAERRRVRQHAR